MKIIYYCYNFCWACSRRSRTYHNSLIWIASSYTYSLIRNWRHCNSIIRFLISFSTTPWLLSKTRLILRKKLKQIRISSKFFKLKVVNWRISCSISCSFPICKICLKISLLMLTISWVAWLLNNFVLNSSPMSLNSCNCTIIKIRKPWRIRLLGNQRILKRVTIIKMWLKLTKNW